jgi:hypothetical protein
MSRFSEKAKLIAAAVFGGVVVISGAATAATGSLPIVSHGHSHQPASHPPDSDNEDQGTEVNDTTTDTDTPDADTDTNTNDNKGAAVSQLAKDPEPGPDHGKTVCNFASGGKCAHDTTTAGTHGKAHQDNATNHRQNTADSHGQAGDTTNDNATSHRQNGLPHGQAGQHGNTTKP